MCGATPNTKYSSTASEAEAQKSKLTMSEGTKGDFQDVQQKIPANQLQMAKQQWTQIKEIRENRRSEKVTHMC